jgi:hypothetical protein
MHRSHQLSYPATNLHHAEIADPSVLGKPDACGIVLLSGGAQMTGIRTIFACSAVFLTFSVASANTIRVPGVVDGFETKDKDGIVDAALIIPTLAASDVFSFDLDSLLGPDERAKAGPISADVPGNTFIPSQKEKYGWITVTLEKNEFGFYTQPGKKEELSSLWFSAPWSLLIEASKGNAKPADLIKSSRFRKAGFAGLKDWSRERKIFMSLDRELRPLGQLNWSRSAAPTGSSDLVVVFQNTPANRWALSGFDGNPGAKATVSSVEGLSPRLKVLGLRSKFVQDNIVSAEGWIVEADRRSKIQFTGVPAPLRGTRIAAKKVFWLNPGGPGWLGVLHHPKAALKEHKLPSFFDGLFPLTKIFPQSNGSASISWFDPRLEEATLPSHYQNGDRLMLIHVGTSREVAEPQPSEIEPELFTYAQSIRSIVVK